MNQTSSSNFSIETGVSSQSVYSNQPGYYSCVINQVLECLFFVVDRNQLGMLYEQIENFCLFIQEKQLETH